MLELMSRSDEVAYVCPDVWLLQLCPTRLRPTHCPFQNIPSVRPEPSGSVLGGIGLAVSAYSELRQVAIDYALFVATQECQRGLYFESGGQPGHGGGTDPKVNQRSSDFFKDTLRTLDLAYLRSATQGTPNSKDGRGRPSVIFGVAGMLAKRSIP